MFNSNINPTILYIFTKIQPTTKATSHIIAKYVPKTTISAKCHICHLGHVYVWDNYVNTYAW